MENDKLLRELMELGISETESKIYLALLEKRELSALEIHELTNVPRTKVYEITQKMIYRGMCIAKNIGNKKKFQAIEPDRVFKKLINDFQYQIDTKKELASKIAKTLEPIYSKGMRNVDIKDYVEVINDMASIHERYVCLVKNTKHELLGFVKSPFATQKKSTKLAEQENTEFEILKKGADARVLYEYKTRDIVELYEHMKRCVNEGEKARVMEKLPIKMYIFDRKYVLMALSDNKKNSSNLTMLVIDNPGLAEATAMLFNFLWEQAEDYTYLEKLFSNKKRKNK